LLSTPKDGPYGGFHNKVSNIFLDYNQIRMEEAGEDKIPL
jgi:hypothetical protein